MKAGAKRYQEGGRVRNEEFRDFRADVDSDIAKLEQHRREAERAARQNQTMRTLFGSGKSTSLSRLFGRTDEDMERGRRRLEDAERELGRAQDYRRRYPDEQPVGSPGRPNLSYKKGGAVKPHYGSTEDIVGHGKTKAAAKADYARKMKAVGLNPRGMAAGGSVASKRADGCVARGKTKGRFV